MPLITRIEICGNVASGKTTLAKVLAQNLGAALVPERFRENPFWSRYYEQPELFRPEKDVFFLAQHTGEIKATENALMVCDYAVFQDVAYAKLSSDPRHEELMRGLYRYLYGQLPEPALVICLHCNEDELLRRIAARARPEESAIDVDFLRTLAGNIEAALPLVIAPVFDIRSDEVGFHADVEHATMIARAVRDKCLR